MALTVGRRRGKAVALPIAVADMVRDGIVFYRSQNGVWLTDHVPPSDIHFGGTVFG
jgi:putative RNA 2'-phosphotransferase